jgi:hypothetical protein
MSSIADSPEIYQYITLGGVRSPWLKSLSGHDRKYGWDTEAAKGQSGASNKYNGVELGEVTAEFYMVDSAGRDQWQAFRAVCKSAVGDAATALPVYHPDLADNDFTEVSVKTIGGLAWDATGGCSVKVVFTEYRPKKEVASATATAKGKGEGGSSSGSSSGEDPNAARKSELAALQEEASAP